MLRTIHRDEMELKFELGARAAATLRRHALLAGTDRRRSFQRTIYFDTDDGDLRKKGYSLRVRQDGRHFTQTVKTSSRSAGQFNREEWEAAVPALRPEMSALQQTPLRRIRFFDQLHPVAQTDIVRTSWAVSVDDSLIEVDLDRGRLIAGGSRRRLYEAELELKEGEAKALFAIARELSNCAPMAIGVLSKEERGSMLARHLLDKEQKASPVNLRRQMNVRQAIELIVHECLRQLRLNEPAITGQRSAEAAHQARVAIRRLRTALSFFRPAIRQRSLEPFCEGLQRFTLPLGRARNLDVFLAAHGQGLNRAERSKLGRARKLAYDNVVDALSSRRTRTLYLDLVEWLATADWAKGKASEPIAEFAGERLSAAWRKVRRRATRLPDLDEKDLHALRISIKKLRYALEFMTGLYPGKDIKKFLASLEKMQDCLGHLHDEMSARQLTDEFALQTMTAAVGDAERSACLAEAAAQFRRLRRLGRVWVE